MPAGMVVVGGGQAGARAAQALRIEDGMADHSHMRRESLPMSAPLCRKTYFSGPSRLKHV